MADVHNNAFIASTRSLYQTGAFSDLLLRTKGREFAVHKAVVCPRSSFFTRACQEGFLEAKRNEIDLVEDEPAVVEHMLSYLYTLDYDDGWDPKMKKATEDEIARGFYRMTLGAPCDSKEGMHPSFDAQAPWEAPEEDEKIGPTAPSDPNNADEPAEEKAADHSREALDISAVKMAAALHDNILVFAIAHKYGVAELKVLAQEKFSARAEIFWSISQACGLSIWHTCGLVKAVYETTPEGERGLRDVVVLLCSKYTNSLMAMEDFRTMTLEVNSFASDLLLKTAASAEEARIEHGKKVELVRDLLRDRQTKILEGQDRSLELAKRLESAEAAFRRTMNIIARYEKCRHCDEVFRPHPEFHLASNFKVLRCSSCNTRHHEE